jgi:hypothetical protein
MMLVRHVFYLHTNMQPGQYPYWVPLKVRASDENINSTCSQHGLMGMRVST